METTPPLSLPMIPLPFYGEEVMGGDILVVGRRTRPFFGIRAVWETPIDLLCWRAPRVLAETTSYRIQRDTHSKWNHVEIIKTTGGKLTCIGANFQGVREAELEKEFPLSKYRLAILRPKIGLTMEQRTKIVAYMDGMLGTKYGFKMIWKIRRALLFGGLEGLYKLTATEEQLRQFPICSVAADRAYAAAGIDAVPHSTAVAAPGDFMDSVLLERIGVWA